MEIKMTPEDFDRLCETSTQNNEWESVMGKTEAATCVGRFGLVGQPYLWQRTDPGQGVIVRCRRCGAWAHSADIPAGHGGYDWSVPRFLVGESGICWTEFHVCDPDWVARVARRGGDLLSACGRLPSRPAKDDRTRA